MRSSPSEGAESNAHLAADALAMKPTHGIPSWLLHVMDIGFLEHITDHPRGTYHKDPDSVYIAFQRLAGTCALDQYLAHNPLTMAEHGYETGTARGATTGAESIVLDGMVIDSPEAAVAHLERIVFPQMARAVEMVPADDDAAVDTLIAKERELQHRLGPTILKVPYGGEWASLPWLRYGQYGYANYLTAYLAYPEIMEKDFALQAECARRKNALAARAILKGNLPRVIRLDHDMADSRGTLVDVRSLDRLWFPHFACAIEPLLQADIRLLWHCDGNLMEMVPRLIECGIGGFQGFQYEDGMDYERICRMRTRDGGPLMIWAGVSVTRTLPFGTPDDVRKEMQWLVNCGPKVGLFLGASSSITPGVPWANLQALMEGLRYYRVRGGD